MSAAADPAAQPVIAIPPAMNATRATMRTTTDCRAVRRRVRPPAKRKLSPKCFHVCPRSRSPSQIVDSISTFATHTTTWRASGSSPTSAQPTLTVSTATSVTSANSASFAGRLCSRILPGFTPCALLPACDVRSPVALLRARCASMPHARPGQPAHRVHGPGVTSPKRRGFDPTVRHLPQTRFPTPPEPE